MHATFPSYLIMFHGFFKIYRDCEAHTECVTVLLAHQNAHIFDWKLQITSFNGTEGRYVFFQQKPGSRLFVAFLIVNALFIFLS